MKNLPLFWKKNQFFIKVTVRFCNKKKEYVLQPEAPVWTKMKPSSSIYLVNYCEGDIVQNTIMVSINCKLGQI